MLKQWIAKNRVRSDAKMVATNPNCPEWYNAYHYKVTLRGFRRVMTVYFSMGYGHSREPSTYDVLECMRSDSGSAGDTFEDFCANLGYDIDSRKAYQIWENVRIQDAKLRQFLGEHYDEFILLQMGENV